MCHFVIWVNYTFNLDANLAFKEVAEWMAILEENFNIQKQIL